MFVYEWKGCLHIQTCSTITWISYVMVTSSLQIRERRTWVRSRLEKYVAFAGSITCSIKCFLISQTNRFRRLLWRDVLVGDVVHISNDETVPADLLLLR